MKVSHYHENNYYKNYIKKNIKKGNDENKKMKISGKAGFASGWKW